MEQIFLTEVKIKKVRHLQDISIPLSNESRKHLIFTGKNGSGKTSVLEALVRYFQYITSKDYTPREKLKEHYAYWETKLDKYGGDYLSEYAQQERNTADQNCMYIKKLLQNWEEAYTEFTSLADMREKYLRGEFILAYYADERKFNVETYNNIEKIELKKHYSINESPGQKLTKYLVDLKAVQAFSKDPEKTKKIDDWFHRFEDILKEIFDDSWLQLIFNEDTFQFSIHMSKRETFDFNTMSSGYAAVFEIINDLIMRMEAQTRTRSSFDLEGIVLIDEIETHLHLELQRQILPILTKLFPNLQFIITTHSPFILNSLDNVVVYDLEKRMLVKEGMQNLPYEGIVEGYFGADRLSDELREKFERYKELVSKNTISDEEYVEIEELEYYLDEIPDYLATDIATEYSRLKLEFFNRG